MFRSIIVSPFSRAKSGWHTDTVDTVDTVAQQITASAGKTRWATVVRSVVTLRQVDARAVGGALDNLPLWRSEDDGQLCSERLSVGPPSLCARPERVTIRTTDRWARTLWWNGG